MDVPSPPLAALGPIGDLRSAFATVRDDPFAILLPSAAALLADLVSLALARETLWNVSWNEPISIGVVGWLVGTCLVRWSIHAVARARILAVAGGGSGFGRPLAVLGVMTLTGPVVGVAGAGVVVPGVAVAAVIGAHGWYTTAAVALAASAVAGTVVTVLVRALFAYAPVEVVLGGRSALSAVGASAGRARTELVRVGMLVGAGDLLVGIGALACGAAALPGYPIRELALRHRWVRTGGQRW